ncbi:LysR family transcriptional regulator [Variovorax paradoxus]|uniref:LysR family transcriptional regulator n=1 Tax=Variovorax paradoxus TaxID=34073 RepID=A0A5Q0M5X5_VARPD|nr:LysR family transcriptional regulator [Variovorax paradoxus]QFZ85051.1 LysR family transcriptional regulator [Variovorax paradoxus]
MDQLTSLRVFREVVESGSFTAAAERLGMSAPMASKRLAQLERTVNARLLHRTSRNLSLTEAGSAYYDQCLRALDILDAAEAAIGQGAQDVRGQLKMSAPVWCATPRFAQALAEYRRRYPDVVLDVHLTNHKVDLVTEGYDLALRATDEPAHALIARPLCQVPFRLVASAAYMKRYACDPEAADAPALDAVVPSYLDLEALMAKVHKGSPRFRLNAVMRSDDTTLTYHAVCVGMGVAFLPDWLVGADLASRRLMHVLESDVQTPSATLFAVYASRQYMAPKLRTFIDFMVETLGE